MIREATPAEFDAVGALTMAAYRKVFPDIGPDNYGAELLAVADRAAADATILVVEGDDGRVVGTVTLALDDNPYFEHRYGIDGDCGFRMLAVDPAAQGRGLGAALVDECIARARAAGRTRMAIASTEPMTVAHGIYERRGFVRRPDLDQWWGDVHGLAFVLDL